MTTKIPVLDNTKRDSLFPKASVDTVVDTDEPPGECVTILHGFHGEVARLDGKLFTALWTREHVLEHLEKPKEAVLSPFGRVPRVGKGDRMKKLPSRCSPLNHCIVVYEEILPLDERLPLRV